MLQPEGRREYAETRNSCYAKHVMKGSKKTNQNTLRKTRNGKDVVSLRGFSSRITPNEDTVILKSKRVPYFYAYILIHLYYKGQLILSDIGRLIDRDLAATWLSLKRMRQLSLIDKDVTGSYYLTGTGRNEVEALRSMLFQ